MVARFKKVVSNLPSTITADTLYAVRVGQGFDLYISDSNGVSAKALNQSRGLPAFTHYAETTTHFYFGWASYNGGWLVRRQDRLTSAISEAILAQNPSKPDLATAWADLQNLIYVRTSRPELVGKFFYVDPNEPDCVITDTSGNVTGVRDLVSGAIALVPDPANTGTVTLQTQNGYKYISFFGDAALVPSVAGSMQLHGKTIYASAGQFEGDFTGKNLVSAAENIYVYVSNRTELGVFNGYDSIATGQIGNAFQWMSFAASLQSAGVNHTWAYNSTAQGVSSRVQNTNNVQRSSAFTVTKIGPIGSNQAATARVNIGLMFSESGNTEATGTDAANKLLINTRTRLLAGVS